MVFYQTIQKVAFSFDGSLRSGFIEWWLLITPVILQVETIYCDKKCKKIQYNGTGISDSLVYKCRNGASVKYLELDLGASS